MAATSTVHTILQRTRRHVQAKGQLMLTPPNLEAELQLALDRLTDAQGESPERRHLFEQSIPLTFTAGVAPLPATPVVRHGSLGSARLVVTGIATPMAWYSRRYDMERGRVVLPRWTTEGNSVVLRTKTTVANGTTGTLQAVCVPTVGVTVGGTTLDDDLIPDLVDLLASWWGVTNEPSGEAPSA